MSFPKLEQFDRAVSLHQQGKTAEAAAIYRDVLAEYPDHAGAWHTLGVAQHQQGEFAAALESIGAAIHLDASQAVFFNNYGAVLQSQNRLVEAIAFFRAAIQIKPEYIDAHVNLGGLLEQLAHWSKALKSYEKVLSLDPNHAQSLQKGAQLAQRLSRFDRAVEFIERIIALWSSAEQATLSSEVTPKRAETYVELGNALNGANRADEAVTAYEQALALTPDLATTFFNLASARAELGQIEEARLANDEACRLAPDKAAWQLRSAVLCPIIFPSTQALDEYRRSLETALGGLLISRPEVSSPELLTAGFFPPFAASFQGRKNRRLKEKFAEVCRPWFTPRPSPARKTDRLRVGFVVTRGHEGIFLRCTAGILEQLNREKFEPLVLCAKGMEGRIRRGLACKDVAMVGLGENLRDAAGKVAGSRCDVLYFWEVGSDALNYYLPFLRLAPVQCTSWGTQVTCGVREVDYYLSSEWIELPEAEEHYTERLWRLRSLPTYQRRIPAPPPSTRDDFGLPEGRHLYLCPQNLLKLHPDQDPLFGQLLRTDPEGLLLIKEGRYRHPAEQLRARFAQTIPDVLDQVRFIPWQSLDDYYRLIWVADVVLDVLYFSAGSSCYDMFSLNQPIVALPGELNVGRYTQACYRRMGFTDLIANSLDDYVHKAIRVACDSDYRQHVRQALAECTPVLFEELEAVREHERFFWAAHEEAVHRHE